LVATGTPFKTVEYKGKKYVPSQCNNAFIFPGIGLGAVISGASKITDNMFFAASIAVRDYAENCKACRENNQLLPPIAEVREINWKVTIAVIKQAIADGVAGISPKADIEAEIEKRLWEPKYLPYKKV
jgi:malic enzyme